MTIDTPLFGLDERGITRDFTDVRMIGNVFDLDNARVRRNDPITSHQAADGNGVIGPAELVLETLRRLGPMHDEKLVAHIQGAAVLNGTKDYSEQRIRTARAGLVADGAVVDTGVKALTQRNRGTTVWAVA